MSDRQRILEDTRAARAKAVELLKALQEAKPGADQSGRDMFKRVTGQSSVENAIAAAKRAVEAYDKVIAELSEPPMISIPERVLGPKS